MHVMPSVQRRRRLATAVLPALLLGGCLSLGGTVPDSLLTLTADSSLPAGVRSAPIGSALIVQQPGVPQKLRTPRIPVQTGDTAIAYVPDAQWVEPPARLFQRLLTDTITATGNRLVLNESENITGPGEVLTGELVNFGIDADSRQAVVTFVAIRLQSDGTQVMQQRFEAREGVARIDAASAGAALNRAANRVAADVATWMGNP